MRSIFIVLVLFLLKTHAKEKDSSAIVKVNGAEKTIDFQKSEKRKETLRISIPDKIFIQTSVDQSKDKEEDWSKNMPWIAAIIIGILTVGGNLLISNYSRKNNSAVAFKQMENAKEIATQQIELLRKNSERDFNKTVLSGTLQLWISDFRTVISELISLLSVFTQKQIMEDENEYKLNVLITKAELMLTEEQNQSELRNNLEELKSCCLDVMAENKSFEDLDALVAIIKKNTLIVLKEESEKARKST